VNIILQVFSCDMGSIRIEEVSDVRSAYNFLEVFQEGATSAFLIITVTEAKELRFTFYPLAEEVSLSQADWERIRSVAKAFRPKTIANEESFQRWFQEQDQPDGDGGSQ
jgi:hypothetical protein